MMQVLIRYRSKKEEQCNAHEPRSIKTGGAFTFFRTHSRFLFGAATILAFGSVVRAESGSWRGPEAHAVLSNRAMEARFQAGRLYQLTDRVTGKRLIDLDPASLPSSLVWFDAKPSNMDAWDVAQQSTGRLIRVTCRTDNGSRLNIH